MKNTIIKCLTISIITIIALTSNVNVFSKSTTKTIEAILRQITLLVGDKNIDDETILYNEKTYVSLDTVAEILDMEIDWDNETNTVILSIYSPNNTEASDPVTENKFIVFWGNTGDKVHIDPSCRTIKNGVLKGTLEECKSAGHTKGWCGVCSDGWSDERFLRDGNSNAR